MKILLLNVTYRRGSTGKIVADLQTEFFRQGHQVVVCYGRGPVVEEAGAYKLAPETLVKIQSLINKVSGNSYGGCWWSTRQLERIIRSEKPDVVNLHCVNASTVDVYRTLRFLCRAGVPTVLTNHAEFLYTGGCGYSLTCHKWQDGECRYCPQFRQPGSLLPRSFFFCRTHHHWWQMKRCYEAFPAMHITCVSDWVRQRALQSPLLHGHCPSQVHTVLNGLDCDVFHYRTEAQPLRKQHNIEAQTKVVLHVTPDFYSAIKGGKHVLEMARRWRHRQDVRFVIVGYAGNGAELPSNVIPIRYTATQAELAAYYSMADVTLLTSQRETFSMVVAEALCCGTPVVGFEAGAPETICIPQYSAFVPQGDSDRLDQVLENMLAQPHDKQAISQEAIAKYDKSAMAQAYMEVYEQCVRQN